MQIEMGNKSINVDSKSYPRKRKAGVPNNSNPIPNKD
tara:strand:- start:507 stop:617 length:111 start_codon:yes stop_codon:yes gene_type:complete